MQRVIPKDVCAVQQSVNHDEKSCNDELHSSINTEKDIHRCEKDTINEHSHDRLNNREKEVNGQKTETLKEVICKDGNEVSDRSDIGMRCECPNNDGECINDDCDIVNTHQNNKLKVISLDDEDSDPENNIPLVHLRKHDGDSDPENDLPLVHLKMLNHQRQKETKMKKPQIVEADFSSDDEESSEVKDGAANCRSKLTK